MMLNRDLSRYRLSRAISDEGALRTCDMLTMSERVFLPLAGTHSRVERETERGAADARKVRPDRQRSPAVQRSSRTMC